MRKVCSVLTVLVGVAAVSAGLLVSPAQAVTGCPGPDPFNHHGGADVRNTSAGIGLGVVHFVDGDYTHTQAGNVAYDTVIPQGGGYWSNGCTGWSSTGGFSIGHGYCAVLYLRNADGTLTRKGDTAHGKLDWGFGIHPIGSVYQTNPYQDPASTNASSNCWDDYRS